MCSLLFERRRPVTEVVSRVLSERRKAGRHVRLHSRWELRDERVEPILEVHPLWVLPSVVGLKGLDVREESILKMQWPARESREIDVGDGLKLLVAPEPTGQRQHVSGTNVVVSKEHLLSGTHTN